MRRDLRAALTALLALTLAACAAAPGGDGLGGTGILAGGDGLGGSGYHPDDDGLGGTGIVGAITGLGSIRVNGLRVAVDTATGISLNGRPAGFDELRVGQVARILAAGRADSLHARSVEVRDAVRGPVEIGARGRVSVLGLEIRPATAAVALPPLSPGQWLAAHGFRHPGGWLAATWVASVRAEGPVHLAGRVGGVSANAFSLGAQRVVPVAGTRLPSAGAAVWVSGTLRDGALVAERLWSAPAVPFDGRAGRLIVQGFARPGGDGLTLDIGDWRVPAPGDLTARLPRSPSTPALIDLRVDAAGNLGIDRLVVDRPALADTPAPPAEPISPEVGPERPDAMPVDRPATGGRPPAAVRPGPPARPPTSPDRPPPLPDRPQPVPERPLPLPEPLPPVTDRPPDVAPVPDIEPMPDVRPAPDSPTDLLTR